MGSLGRDGAGVGPFDRGRNCTRDQFDRMRRIPSSAGPHLAAAAGLFNFIFTEARTESRSGPSWTVRVFDVYHNNAPGPFTRPLFPLMDALAVGA